MNITPWIVQALLALIFLFAGGIKLVLPLEEMAGPIPLPGWFLRFIGVCEVLGAIGVLLPGLVGICPALTPLAAAGLLAAWRENNPKCRLIHRETVKQTVTSGTAQGVLAASPGWM